MRWLWIQTRCVLVLALGALSAGGCGDDSRVISSGGAAAPLRLNASFDHRVVLPTSVLTFALRGTEALVITRAQISFEGTRQDGQAVRFEHEVRGGDEVKQDDQGASLQRERGDVGELRLALPVSVGLWQAMQVEPIARFEGQVRIVLFDPFNQRVALVQLDAVALDFQVDVTPRVTSIEDGDLYLGQAAQVQGDTLLRPEEGSTYALITQGRMRYPDGTARQLQDVRVPIRWAGRRERGELIIDPEVFGVRPGEFEGDLVIVNALSDGRVVMGNARPGYAFSLQPSFISVPDPAAGSRGQRITIRGRGLIPTRPKARMTLVFRGRFTPADASLPAQDFTGANALERSPDRVLDDQAVEVAVWYEIVRGPDGRGALTGLGAAPGVFVGTITPRHYDEQGRAQDGLPWEGSFRVLPTRQVVYLKYLPRFSQALDKYGLRNVERELRQAILQVAQRPYSEVNVVFTDTLPTDYIDYATLELSGPDPYGRKAFGYDNSFNGVAKDVDNLYLADYIGGWNQGSKEAFDNPFGGVYIESFDYFSPKLSGMNAQGAVNRDASDDFDAIMGPFMPALGGKPVKATEWPDGPRAEQIRRALHMVSNVVGNTVAHEVGHSMGLSFYESDRERPGNVFHNRTPGPGHLMDAGSDRPFDERANLNGVPAATFNERNLTYLKEILPLAP